MYSFINIYHKLLIYQIIIYKYIYLHILYIYISGWKFFKNCHVCEVIVDNNNKNDGHCIMNSNNNYGY